MIWLMLAKAFCATLCILDNNNNRFTAFCPAPHRSVLYMPDADTQPT